jgi:L-amino acid N-acyltransferase YncA
MDAHRGIMNLIIHRMLESDIRQIMNIQAENLRQNLTPLQQKYGYLSIAFSVDQFKAFNKDLCVAVAKEYDEVIGYCCISSTKFNSQFPILDQIIANISIYAIPETHDTLIEEETCIYGPVCISISHRGKGVLKKLSSFGLTIAKEKGYSYCLSFISSENAHSLSAHMKLSFHIVGKVNYQCNEYIVIACKL